MKLRLMPLTLLILLVPTAALAQVPVPAPVQTLSTETMVIALLSVLVGYITHSISTGKVFGIKTIPLPWLPYLGLAGAFLTPLTVSISAAAVLSQVAWFNALLAGLIGLGGFVSGVTGKQAIDAHTTTGKGDATTNKQSDAVSAAADKLTPPAAHRGMIRGALVGAVSALLVVAAVLLTGCPQAVTTTENVAQVVLADFAAGKSRTQIETDACIALGGTSLEDVVCKDVSALIVDIIEAALAKSQLSGIGLTNAQAYKASHAKVSK